MPSKKTASSTPAKNRPIENYTHPCKDRVNNPPVGLVTPQTDPDVGKKEYAYDPHLDPQLVWAGKAEHTSFEVPTVSLHVHERIDPRSIMEAVRKRNGDGGYEQGSLFESIEENRPIREAIEFYKHKHNWSNRLIAGDSLLVMNSLLEKEGLGGQVQMIYIDPPYGIKYGSNFQPFVNKRDVKDGKDEDLNQEPEMIRAFRDTWELGLHSYLTYLRDRLLLARELLHESGSCFVQISDENLHLIRNLMDEVFGIESFVSIVSFTTTSGFACKTLSRAGDYIVWYSKNREKIKYYQMFKKKNPGDEGATKYKPIEVYSSVPKEWYDPQNLVSIDSLTSQGPTNSESEFVIHGRKFCPPKGMHWKTTVEGIKRLINAKRLVIEGNSPRFLRFLDDFPVYPINNIWTDIGGVQNRVEGKIYVVQTSASAIERCLLMTTDPGDLVFDPTCLRAGTRVVVAGRGEELPPYNPPVNGGMGGCADYGNGVKGENRNPCSTSERSGTTSSPSPFTGRGGEGSTSNKGYVEGSLKSIETIRPGDFVLSHDGKFHRVKRIVQRRYTGQMIGIRHVLSEQLLWMTSDHRVLVGKRHYAMNHQRNWSHVPNSIFAKARALRKKTTPAEQTLWKYLRRSCTGAKFRRQHPIGPYIVDFYCAERALIVEVDGDSHYTTDAMEYDRKRTEELNAHGLNLIRFTNNDIRENIAGVLERIDTAAGEPAKGFKEDALWIAAADIRIGDKVFCGTQLTPIEIIDIRTEKTTEIVYDLVVDEAHSFLTETCIVHNCGSGTTAYVAEQWGRRWITCDTSRVAATLAKQRLMTATFDYYELAHPNEGVDSGFTYKTVPHITLKSIANNPEIREGMTRDEIDTAIQKYADQETLYDQPIVDTKKVRVTGPFTVEAVPAPAVKPLEEVTEEGMGEADKSIARTGETLRQSDWRDELFKTGIRGKGKQSIEFSRVEPLPGTRWLHVDGETKENKPQRVVVSFGPEHAPLEQRQVALAIEDAQTLVPKPSIVVFAAFQFDPEAAKDIDETNWPGVTLLKAQMNADLLTEDLKKKRASNESFWLIGQPDVRLEKIKTGEHKGLWRVEVLGFDYYNTKSGVIESGGQEKIAMWLLDPDYDGRSLFPRQVFFPIAAEKEGWAKLAKNLKAEIDEELIEAYRGTVSLPFKAGNNKRIAVKIIDDRGIESLRVMGID